MFWDLNKLDKLLHNLLYNFNAPNSTNEQMPNEIARFIDDVRKQPASVLQEILSVELQDRTAKLMESFGVPCRDCTGLDLLRLQREEEVQELFVYARHPRTTIRAQDAPSGATVAFHAGLVGRLAESTLTSLSIPYKLNSNSCTKTEKRQRFSCL